MRFAFLKSFSAVIFTLGFYSFLFSQDRALGTWKLFMPYGASRGVFDAGDKVYSASEKSLFSYEMSSGTIQIYDKATGLSDVGIQTMNYDPPTKALVVAYANSNIDLIFNGTDVYNIPDIKNKAATGAISINSISFYDGIAYLSTSIGISLVNLSKKEIANTYIIGSLGGPVNVSAASTDGTNIYAATDEGVKHALLSSPNLQNFNNWSLYGAAENLPQKKATHVATLNNKVYTVIGANNSDTLFEWNGTTWTNRYCDSFHTFKSIDEVNGSLYFSTWHSSGGSGKNGKVDASGNITVFSAQHARPVGWFKSDGISWEGDSWSGLGKNNNGSIEWIVPDGPGTSNVRDIEIANESVYVATGGADESWSPVFTSDGFFIYKNSSWINHNQYTDPELGNFLSILNVASFPGSSKVYFGSFLFGLLEFDKNTNGIEIYDKWNSILEGSVGDTQRTKISCLTTDRGGNLWIGNSGALKAIKMIGSDGTWKEFAIPYNIALMKQMLIDQNGQLWAPVRRIGEGLLVWSNNGTLDDPSDDMSRMLSTGENLGGLPDPSVYCVAEDKEGNIWAGTNQGIAIFYCPGSVLSANGCDADQVKVERDGYIGYLFGTESVRSIAVDAANRKWIGTNNGLWLVSADGKEELLKFTTENSPLPANQITDIAIEEKTGEVFIGTTGGMVSYQGDAIGDCIDCDKALVYPNPVKPDYHGPIAIKGLADDAYVKITDIAGTLVYQGKANGTQMIWDGKGYSGTRAKSGVYLVFSSTELGKEKKSGKDPFDKLRFGSFFNYPFLLNHFTFVPNHYDGGFFQNQKA